MQVITMLPSSLKFQIDSHIIRLNWIINVIFLVFNIKQVAWAWVLIIVVNDNYYFWFFKLETVWFTFIIHLMQRL